MRYMLRTIGVSIDSSTQMLGHNKKLVTNLSITCINLKKKHNAVSYHQVNWLVAAGLIKVSHVLGKYNPDGILAKLVSPQHQYPLTKKHLVYVRIRNEGGVIEFCFKYNIRP